MSQYKHEYGQRVRRARLAAELDQVELARRLGLCRSSITNLEAGRHSQTAEQVMATAQVLAVDPRWLLTGWAPDHVVPKRPEISRKELDAAATSLRAVADTISQRPEGGA